MVKNKKKAQRFHYVGCGLDYIYLMNGFRIINDPELGEMVAIRDIDGLHESIALSIINKAPCIRGQEIRFFRSFLKLSQTQMALLVKKDMRTIQRWEEKRNHPIPQDAENFLRFFLSAHLDNQEITKKICAMLKAVRDETEQPKSDKTGCASFDELDLSDTNQGWKAA